MKRTLVLALLLGTAASVQVNAFPFHRHAHKQAKPAKPAKAKKN